MGNFVLLYKADDCATIPRDRRRPKVKRTDRVFGEFERDLQG